MEAFLKRVLWIQTHIETGTQYLIYKNMHRNIEIYATTGFYIFPTEREFAKILLLNHDCLARHDSWQLLSVLNYLVKILIAYSSYTPDQ